MNRLGELIVAQKKLVAMLVAAIALLAVAATAARVYNNYSVPARTFDWNNRGLSDFHNGTYFPTLAFRNGDNPYALSVVEKYPMARAAPSFSPVIFILHLPLSILSLHVADAVFFVGSAALIALLGVLSVRFSAGPRHLLKQDLDQGTSRTLLVAVVCAWLFLSRPGHITLFTGYFTAELVLGMIVALHYARSKPALAGLGIMLSSGKPNFVIPLIILMFCRRDWRAVCYGIVFSAAAGLAGLLWLALHSSLSEVIAGVREGQAALHSDEAELPVNTWTRVDITGIIAKALGAAPGDSIYLAAMFGFLAIPGYVVFKLSQTGYEYGATGLSGFIIVLSVLLSIYHHSYDCLVVTIPWVGATFFGQRVLPGISKIARYWVVGLTAVPAISYFSSWSFRDWLGLDPFGWVWQGMTMINGICLFAALVILLSFAIKQIRLLESCSVFQESATGMNQRGNHHSNS